jgi:hypothetical protein
VAAKPTPVWLLRWLPALLLLAWTPALAGESPVPLFSPTEVAALGGASTRMVGDSTCEMVSPVTRGKGHVVAGAHVALYRAGKRKPFMHAVTREDGVYVALFPAKPNEVVYVRAFREDPRTGRVILGSAARSVCVPATVSVGEARSVDQIGDSDSIEN